MIASWTRAAVSGRTPGIEFNTRDTVWCETPARAATSAMVAERRARGPAKKTAKKDAKKTAAKKTTKKTAKKTTKKTAKKS